MGAAARYDAGIMPAETASCKHPTLLGVSELICCLQGAGLRAGETCPIHEIEHLEMDRTVARKVCSGHLSSTS